MKMKKDLSVARNMFHSERWKLSAFYFQQAGSLIITTKGSTSKPKLVKWISFTLAMNWDWAVGSAIWDDNILVAPP